MYDVMTLIGTSMKTDQFVTELLRKNTVVQTDTHIIVYKPNRHRQTDKQTKKQTD
jgi:hypothetical protein